MAIPSSAFHHIETEDLPMDKHQGVLMAAIQRPPG